MLNGALRFSPSSSGLNWLCINAGADGGCFSDNERGGERERRDRKKEEEERGRGWEGRKGEGERKTGIMKDKQRAKCFCGPGPRPLPGSVESLYFGSMRWSLFL